MLVLADRLNICSIIIIIYNNMLSLYKKRQHLIVKEKLLPKLLINLSQEYVKERLMMFCRIVKLFLTKSD